LDEQATDVDWQELSLPMTTKKDDPATQEPASSLGQEGHVPALDGVRGIAILLVLLFHFPAPFAWLVQPDSIGWCGVDLFFVLSGYLITGILYSSANKPHYFRNFYIRRSLRIFPLYYGFLVLTLLIFPRFIDPYWLGLENEDGGVMKFFLYYSNYTNVFESLSKAPMGAFWSLAVEEHFYLFWPMFIKVTPKHRLLLWCSVIVLLALFSRLAITALKMNWQAAYYLTTSRVDSLVIGAMTAILVRQHPEVPKRWFKVVGGTCLAILVAVAIWRGNLYASDGPMRTFGYSVIALLFVSVVWMAGNTHGRASRFLANPILVSFGKYSYGIYVYHLLVLTVCQRWLGPTLFPLLGWSDVNPLAVFTISLIATYGIAYLSWHLYEKPILSLKTRFAS
jgi:peptidoglycan/LPS O-acetylase OafA/YrhL